LTDSRDRQGDTSHDKKDSKQTRRLVVATIPLDSVKGMINVDVSPDKKMMVIESIATISGRG